MSPTVRKLAPEAVIFMLLAGVVGAVWLPEKFALDAYVLYIALAVGIGFVVGLGAGLIIWALYLWFESQLRDDLHPSNTVSQQAHASTSNRRDMLRPKEPESNLLKPCVYAGIPRSES